MKIKVGEYEVYDSGTIVSNKNEPIDFFLDESVSFTVRLVFIDDENQIQSATAEIFEKNGIQITFVNYNNSFGNGNPEPIPFGKFKNRELFFNYRIYGIDLGGKHIHYTWLLGKEVANG
jgi:hypothetical protein